MIDNGKYTNIEIAEKYGICKTTVSKIKNKRNYKKIWKMYNDIKLKDGV